MKILGFALLSFLSLSSTANADTFACITSPSIPNIAYSYEDSVRPLDVSQLETIAGDSILNYPQEMLARFTEWKNIKNSMLEETQMNGDGENVEMIVNGVQLLKAPYIDPDDFRFGAPTTRTITNEKAVFTFAGQKVSELRYDFCGKD